VAVQDNGQFGFNKSSFQRLYVRYFLNKEYSRYLVLTLFVVATTLIMPSSSVERIEFQIGTHWEEDEIFAPFDFAIEKNEKMIDEEKNMLLKQINQPFLLHSPIQNLNRQRIKQYIKECIDLGDWWRQQQGRGAGADRQLLKNKLADLQPPIKFEMFVNLPPVAPVFESMEKHILEIYDPILARGYLSKNLSEINSPFISLRSTESIERLIEPRTLYDKEKVVLNIDSSLKDFSPPVAEWLHSVLVTYCQPNYLYSPELHDEEKKAKLTSLSKFYGKIKRGHLIVKQGDLITQETASILESLHNEKLRRNQAGGNTYLSLLGQFLMVLLLTVVTTQFLRVNRREIYNKLQKISLLFFIIFLMTGLVVILQKLGSEVGNVFNITYFHIIPICMAPIMITVFFDDRIGFFSNLVIALLAGLVVHHNFEFFFIQTCSGSIAVFSLTTLRRRAQFFSAAGILLIAYFISYFGYNLYLKGSFTDINYNNFILFIINVLFTLSTYPLIYLFEKMFGVASDLTYIELLDTNHPLLKQMALKAPGTYQHSMMVANIAEALANKIGAHSLQVRVGAMFHDIGKILQPQYFVENQPVGVNPHANLDPKTSAEIILNHVDHGESLALQYKLPQEIIDFIKTHHGTTRVEFFYRSFLKTHSEQQTNEQEFRYKGPLPTSKEMAILMISDSIEASSRALDHPTPQDLEQLVEHIISYKIKENQLMHARISFRDLYRMKLEINKILQSIYHSRIKYPDVEKLIETQKN